MPRCGRGDIVSMRVGFPTSDPRGLTTIRPTNCYHGNGLRSLKKPPVGPSSGSVASQIAVSAESLISRMALGPPIRWNLFAGGAIRSQIDAEKARTEQLIINYERAVLLALEEVEDAMMSYEKEVARRGHLENSVDTTQRSLDLVLTQNRAGLTDFQNVLRAFAVDPTGRPRRKRGSCDQEPGRSLPHPRRRLGSRDRRAAGGAAVVVRQEQQSGGIGGRGTFGNSRCLPGRCLTAWKCNADRKGSEGQAGRPPLQSSPRSL